MHCKMKNGVWQEYTVANLRADYPGTSFPEIITDEVAAEFGVFPCTMTPPPEFDATAQQVVYRIEYQGGERVQVWDVTDLSEDQVKDRWDAKAREVRQLRDSRLNTDVDPINAVRWAAMTADEQQAWETYRKALLDIPQQAGFPWNVTWPVMPGAIGATVSMTI